MPASLLHFKALADETRLRLLNVLSRHELNVNELVLILEMGQSRISRHLKILSSAGLLEWRRDGLWVFYSIPSEGEGKRFLDAILQFIVDDPTFTADIEMAKSMVEERVHKTQQFFNSIAEDWDKLSREVLGGFDLVKAVAEHMPKCHVAADLGCGTGNMLKGMLGKADMVIGVDGSARMLELARRKLLEGGDRVSLRIGDLAHLPFRDGEADFACLNMVLHHVSSPADALTEIRRVLTASGRLVITDFNSHTNESMRLEYGDRWLGFERQTLHSFITKAGFSIVESHLAPVEQGLFLHLIAAQCSG